MSYYKSKCLQSNFLKALLSIKESKESSPVEVMKVDNSYNDTRDVHPVTLTQYISLNLVEIQIISNPKSRSKAGASPWGPQTSFCLTLCLAGLSDHFSDRVSSAPVATAVLAWM